MTFNRTLQVLLLIAVAGAAAAVGGNARAADNTSTKEVRIGFQKYGTLALLRAKGTLEPRLAKEGISVKWAEFPGGPQLLEALNIGSVDFGNTGETPPVFAQAAGADLLYVAYEPPAPAGEAILVSKNSAIKNVSDLKGKRVALNKGSNVHYLLVRALENAGLSLADIQPIYLAPADGRAAFQSGSVDAWVIWDPFQAAAEKQLEARTLKDGIGLVDNHQFYLARRPFANANAKVISILLEEIRGIGEWSKQSPAEVAKQVAPVIGLPEDVALIAVKRQGYDVRPITPAVVAAQQKIADTFYHLKLIPKPLDIRSASLLPAKTASH
ncbi:MAG TPA: sulfonate ABC transporter substrate-binding protein [Rhodocyclaceae bacterium]|nr:sulfonate ABC transporter substrate-binding protein [Rhodocyclaceae bacterium]